MREKVRFGKRYYQNEQGEWIYLVDTMAEEEYRDRIREGVSTFKTYTIGIAWIAAVIALYIYKPDVLEEIASNPVVMGVLIVLGVIAGLFLLLVLGSMLYVFMKEAIPAFRRDILGQDID